ncbi:MAG: hypothetical protein KDM91_11225 [Verrucomicrobiae bacterium]|nr:hypothetical protein [Verrucomicrobiae bacterium]
MRASPPSTRAGAGFSLLEVVLALGLFTMAAVSLVGALNDIGRYTADSVRESWVTEKLRSTLIEVGKNPRLEEMRVSFDPDASGTFVSVEVERFEARSVKGENLPNLYRIKAVVARKRPGGHEEVLGEAETLRYLPMFQQQ